MVGKHAVEKHSSVWTQMGCMYGPAGAERLRAWLPVLVAIRAATAERRRRVLAYDWARKRLRLILNLNDAARWNGYVPPATDQGGHVHDNPIRTALVELLRDVENAELDDAGDIL